MTAPRIDMDHLNQWLGKSETLRERIAPFPANALAATLDRDDAPYAEGTPLPPLWHWLHFLPVHKLSECGRDGHAAKGGFLPPVPLPRRMWAGSRFRFLADMPIGALAEKRSTIGKITHKTGRSGDLVFVTVNHDYFVDGTQTIAEEHDIVYREDPHPGAPAPQPQPAPEGDDFTRAITPDPVLLFRYSALTFNGHRIHYDQPYSTGVEGYAGLVVHGPLIATLLMDTLRRHTDARVTGFAFRALATITDNMTFSTHLARQEDGRVRLWARREDGALAMDATAELEG